MESSQNKPRRKCVQLERLRGDAYRSLFNLARVCRAFELRTHDPQVLVRIREVLSQPPVAEFFAGWDDKKLSRYFYTHFVQRKAISESVRRKRELIIIVSGCNDDAAPDVRRMEVTRGLGSYMEERVGRPLSYPLVPRPSGTRKFSGNSSRKRSRADADGAEELRQDMVVDDVNGSEEEDTTVESSLTEDIEHQGKRLAAGAQEDIGESSTVDPAIESS